MVLFRETKYNILLLSRETKYNALDCYHLIFVSSMASTMEIGNPEEVVVQNSETEHFHSYGLAEGSAEEPHQYFHNVCSEQILAEKEAALVAAEEEAVAADCCRDRTYCDDG